MDSGFVHNFLYMDPIPALIRIKFLFFFLVFASSYRDWGGCEGVRTVHTHTASSSIPRSITYPKKECTEQGKKKRKEKKGEVFTNPCTVKRRNVSYISSDKTAQSPRNSKSCLKSLRLTPSNLS